ncbi:MAG: DUF5929 domain-containing protein [Flavicella sp.]
MVNKRLLIRNLLNHNDENTFFDKKRKIDLDSKEGKAKFLKHICALSNSNPYNKAFIVVGIDDDTNTLLGVDFFDDSRIQDLINSCLVNSPKITYENISFSSLQRHKVIALVTIYPLPGLTFLKKNYWKYNKGMVFYRKGSTSTVASSKIIPNRHNKGLVNRLEKSSSNTLELTLQGVCDFMASHPPEREPRFQVFKDSFVLCWAGEKVIDEGKVYYKRVDIQLVKEQVSLFYSTLDRVQIQFGKDAFVVTEYVSLGIENIHSYYPLEKTVFHFKDNGKHVIIKEFLFECPNFDRRHLHHVFNSNTAILKKLEAGCPLETFDLEVLKGFPNTYLICSLHGFEKAKENLKSARKFLKNLDDKLPYIKYKEAMRVLRKVKYK